MTDPSNQTGDQPGAQPQYGQYQQPEYGAMANQYPAGYDPYVYGRPDTTPAAESQGGQAAQPNAAQSNNTQPASSTPSQWPANQPPYGYPQQPNPYGRPMRGMRNDADPNRPPHLINGINVDDPNQNPLYGRWDLMSVFSLLCALFFPVPVLPALMGAVSMRRTKLFHMKGFWLGFAAVFINVFYTIMVVWLAVNGISMTEYYQAMLNMLQGGGAGGGSDGGSVSA